MLLLYLPSVVAVILCAALAFYFAVPSQDTAIQPVAGHSRVEQYMLVDSNTAGLSALCTLPGVGESRARAILEYRDRTACLPGGGCSPAFRLMQTVVDSWKGQATVS